MGSVDIKAGGAARTKIVAGVDALADAVAITFGPRGRNVILDRATGIPLATRDGVTIAKNLELPCKFENAGAQVVKEAAVKSGLSTGDGTTATILLTRAFLRGGMKMVNAGFSPQGLQRDIDQAVVRIDEALHGQARPSSPQDVLQVATIAAGGDEEIGRIVADAVAAVGARGAIAVEPSRSMVTRLDIREGLEFPRGYVSASFVNDRQRQKCVLKDAYVLICDGVLSSGRELLPVLEALAGSSRGLLIVAEDVVGEALSTLAVNSVRGTLKVCAVRAPEFNDRQTDLLHDLAAVLGTHVISPAAGFAVASLSLADLGRADRIEVGAASTTIIGARGTPDQVRIRVGQTTQRIEARISDFDAMMLNDRLAKLQGRAVVITVGGATELDMTLNRTRIEKALSAARAAMEDGVVPGGGLALMAAGQNLENRGGGEAAQTGAHNVVRRALEEPLRRLAHNAGANPSEVVARIYAGEGKLGYDPRGNAFGSVDHIGVVDPVKVVRTSLQIAASTAGLILTNAAMIVDAPRVITIHEHDARVCGCGCGDR